VYSFFGSGGGVKGSWIVLFAPASFRYGVWMSLAGLAALLAGFALVYRRKRPSQNFGCGT
jgi:LPXTG-motif cell wall-anchored protein